MSLLHKGERWVTAFLFLPVFAQADALQDQPANVPGALAELPEFSRTVIGLTEPTEGARPSPGTLDLRNNFSIACAIIFLDETPAGALATAPDLRLAPSP